MEIVAYLVLGLVAGGLAATLGIGGGVVYVPAFVTLFGMAQLTAQGTSLAIIVPTAIVATIGHARHHRIRWQLAAVMALTGILGAVAGARLALVADERVLRRVFAVVLVLVAIRMILRAIGLRNSVATDRSVDDTRPEER